MVLPVNVQRPSKWLSEAGPEYDVVISSRARFARNLSNYPFYDKNPVEKKEKLRGETFGVLEEMEFTSDWNFLALGELAELERELLAERRLASDELISERQSGVVFSEAEDKAVMVNEEDHLRLQAIAPGFDLDSTYEAVTSLERSLNEQVKFAYDSQWGYLSACPTNLGTGFRASVLLHLPGLVLQQKINKILKAISNLGLTVRGFYGEGSETKGFYFQLSNQVTLGQSAENFKASLERVVDQVITQERKAREELLNSSGVELEDRIGRSYGILKHARKIKTREALQLLSLCRLGVDRGLVPHVDLKRLDGLLQLLQPAHLQCSVGEELSEEQRDFYRAEKVEGEFSEAPP